MTTEGKGAVMHNSVSPEAARIARKGAALIAANDELARAGYAALMEASPILARQTARLFCAIYAPSRAEEEIEATFDNLPL